jgi:hypothetical protein
VAVGASITELKAMYASEIAEPSPRHQTSLIAARARQCRFIVSDGTREAICCGAPTSETSSWCAWHRQIVYTPRPSERDRRLEVGAAGAVQRPRAMAFPARAAASI